MALALRSQLSLSAGAAVVWVSRMTLIPRVQRGRRRSQIASVVDLSAALFSRGTARLSSEIESETPFPPLRSVPPSFLSTSHQLYHNSNGAPFSSTPRRQQQLLLSNAAFLSSLSERVNDERTNGASIVCLRNISVTPPPPPFSFPSSSSPSFLALYPFRCD